MARRPLIAVVDDDESVRESLPDLLGELGFDSETFASAQEFLSSGRIHDVSCMILDIAMPGMTGPDLHEELGRRGHSIPTIFITAKAENGIRARLLRQGAVEVLFKPFDDEALRAALYVALPGDRSK
jgi:FixJ family two-component response regulator